MMCALRFRRLVLLLAVVVALATVTSAAPHLERVHAFNFINFTFDTSAQVDAYIGAETYRNVPLAGVKVSHDGDIYVTCPRWKAGVPATLARLSRTPSTGMSFAFDAHAGAPLLRPFPSWEWNKVGDKDAFQSVLGIEIDRYNRLYVLDQGRMQDQRAQEGSIKLVVFDLNSLRGKPEDAVPDVVFKHVFSDDVAPLYGSFLNDLVVDSDAQRVYIADSGNLPAGQPGDATVLGAIIVLDMETNEARRLLPSVESTVDDPSVWITINGRRVLPGNRIRVGADGIALSPDGRTLYWCPMTSRQLYAIATSVLNDPALDPAQVEEAVVHIGHKSYASDGLAMDNKGRLYVTFIEDNSVGVMQPDVLTDRWSRSGERIPYSLLASGRDLGLIWPDTFAFDHNGAVVFNSDTLHLFMEDLLNYTDNIVPNYAIWRVHVDADSADTPLRATDDNDDAISRRPWVILTICVAALALVSAVAYLFVKRRNRQWDSTERDEFYSLMSSQTEME